MTLNSRLLSSNLRLQKASNNEPPLRQTESGGAVVQLQTALMFAGIELPVSTSEQSKVPDGIFGSETAKAVRQFQQENGLVADGVPGRNTLERLDQLVAGMGSPQPSLCGNGHSTHSHGNSITCQLTSAVRRQVGNLPSANYHIRTTAMLGISLPSGIRWLTKSQESTATSVYGTSLCFSKIFITNALGAGGRGFTFAVFIPVLLGWVVIMNVGTYSPRRDLLIHELAHAWQSQHHVNPVQFMINSASSQVLAEAVIKATGAPASAYAYKPGKSFGLYAAEQIARQIENGETAIVQSAKGKWMLLPHLGNHASLAVPRYEIIGAKGVKT